MNDIPETMIAVQLLAHGGMDTLFYNEAVPIPVLGPNDVLIKVLAAGVNNTDINTRIGWYASDLKISTAESLKGEPSTQAGDWAGTGLHFPRIQGADVCGTIVRVGAGGLPTRVGQRVIVQSCLRSQRQGDFTPWLGSERDGAFAQFVAAPSADTYVINSTLSDAQLATLPCAYATAENLISRARVKKGDNVLITGASGNVGIAAIQLAKRRGATVCVIAADAKFEALKSLGADECLSRHEPIGASRFDVVIDVVGGPQWPQLLDGLKPRGRYAVSGAIAGPIVELDLRKLYLKDLTLFGCTSQDDDVFTNLVSYVERGEIKPIVAKQYPLSHIAQAQEAFLSKAHLGKIILVPPQ